MAKQINFTQSCMFWHNWNVHDDKVIIAKHALMCMGSIHIAYDLYTVNILPNN